MLVTEPPPITGGPPARSCTLSGPAGLTEAGVVPVADSPAGTSSAATATAASKSSPPRRRFLDRACIFHLPSIPFDGRRGRRARVKRSRVESATPSRGSYRTVRRLAIGAVG